jgi:hypothetical protein
VISERLSDDRLTIVAFAIIAGFFAAVMHEGLGHGLVAYLQGSRALTMTNCYLSSDIGTRAIDAAGTLVNLGVGLIAWLVLRRSSETSFSFRYACWLVMTVNLFDSTGYFFYSGVAAIGDWQAFIKDLHPYWLWRAGLVLVGSTSYFGVIVLSMRWLTRLLAGSPNAEGRVRRLVMLPYFVIGIAGTIAALPNLLGWKLIVTAAAAATFGGLAGFFSVGPWVQGRLREGNTVATAEPGFIARNRLVIVLAVLVFIVNVSIFGRGLTWQDGQIHFAQAGKGPQ